MIQDLVVTFGKSNGKEHDWTYKGLDPSLTTPEIKEACELLTTLDIFEQDGVKLFDSVVTAKVLTHREHRIFDPEHDCTPEVTMPEEPTCAEVRCFEVNDLSEKECLPINELTTCTLSTAPIPAITHSRESHYQRLTQVKPLENMEAAIKVEKDTLPPSKESPQVEIIGSEGQKQTPNTNKMTKTKEKRLFQRIFRRRSRNKEAPESTQRE